MDTRLNIIVAPSSFKESLGADEAADAIEAGIRRVLPHSNIRKIPLHDGGEGFSRGVVAASNGTIQSYTVTGPVGQPVRTQSTC